MGDSTFNAEAFLRDLAERTNIYTAGEAIQNRDVPVNVDPNEWKLQKLQDQMEMVELNPASEIARQEQFGQTNTNMAGGAMADSANYQPPPDPEVQQARNGSVLDATTNTPSVPTEGEGVLDAVDPTASLAQEAPPDAVLPEVTVEAPRPPAPVEVAPVEQTETQKLESQETLSQMFKKHMSKVQKVQFGKMSDSQKSDVRMRFFLRLMEEGDKRNSSGLLGNIGIAGRHAMDAKRIINEENNKNEMARYKMDAEEVFNALTMISKDRSNQISAKRWDLAAKAAAAKIKAGEMQLKKANGGWVLIDMKTGKSEPILDKDGKQLQWDGTSDNRNLTGDAAVLDWLAAGGDKKKSEERWKGYARKDKIDRKSTKADKDTSWDKRHKRSKAISEIQKDSKDEFGRGGISREEAAEIYDADNPTAGVQARARSSEPKKKRGKSAIAHLPKEVRDFANEINDKINNGGMSKDQGIAALKEKYPEVPW
jgi:hypothetical protein